MFFRALVTSGFLALFFWGIWYYSKVNNILDFTPLLNTSYLIIILWIMGFLSTIAYVYGRKLRKIFGRHLFSKIFSKYFINVKELSKKYSARMEKELLTMFIIKK